MAEKKFIDAYWLTSKIFPFGMVADGNYPINAKSIKLAIDNAPSADVVEVVRCKDCKYCETVLNIIGDPKLFCTRMVGSMPVDFTEYCSYGERKEQT